MSDQAINPEALCNHEISHSRKYIKKAEDGTILVPQRTAPTID